ncbi:MAG: peptidoglycan editing factor PgeF [Pseudomonadota bacterium]|nr:peptidoglycan editing factor PgeF [Pseudomonadota bacterium]
MLLDSNYWITPDWPAPPNVRAAVTTRFGPGVPEPPFEAFNLGTRCGDDLQAVAANRARLREALVLPSEPCWLRQFHGTHVAIEPQHDEPQADAAVTRTPGTVLAILTADCLPVFFCAEDGSEVAAAHAGWRGLSAGMVENTLAAMRTPDGSIMAWLGPAIGRCAYEVGEEVRDAFVAHDRAAAKAFTLSRTEYWFCDLCELARQRLFDAGVTRIFGGGFDTFSDPRFYSHRRDGARSGRFASLIHIASSDPASSLERHR